MSNTWIAIVLGASALLLALPVMYAEWRLRQRDRRNWRGKP